MANIIAVESRRAMAARCTAVRKTSGARQAFERRIYCSPLPLFATVPPDRDVPHAAPSPQERAGNRVGIARLAASSPLAEAKRGIEYFLLPARSILNRCSSERVGFTWTINPYRGCEFGCRYCYARYTHEYMELDGSDFERKIFVKENAAHLIARELRACAVRGEHIAIGTATDPYQPAEREFGVTRAILEELAKVSGLSISITTKSDQVVRDIEVLRRIATHSEIGINLSVTTPRPGLARLLEPRAPRPDLRIGAVRQLREAGISAGILVIPILPGLTDRQTDLEILARAARDAGACWFSAGTLFLMPCSRQQFFPFLEQKFPRLAEHYRRWYERAAYAPKDYQREISGRIAKLRAEYGLFSREHSPEQEILAGGTPETGQLSLGFKGQGRAIRGR